MDGFFRTTPFGQLLRLCSKNSLLRYPDEVDSTLWKAFAEQAKVSVTSPNEKIGSEDGAVPLQSSIPDGQSQTLNNEGDIFLVGRYGPHDPENPHNWPYKCKLLTLSQMFVLNFCIYIGSSIYVPGEASIMYEFGVSETVATLGLSMYTVGYGLGPMLWSPLSEVPVIGRSSIFFWTLAIFVILQLGVGFAPNMATFLIFRTLTGFFGSPCLATGPIIGGYIAPVKGWTWTIWIFTWLCTLVLLTMFFLLPETSTSHILHARAARIRRFTSCRRFKSQSEIDTASNTPRDHLRVLSRAFTLTFTEPIVLLMDLYTGLAFLGIFVGSVIAAPLLIIWLRGSIVPRINSPKFTPEMLLPPAFFGCPAFPACLFWYGFSSRADVHWIVPVSGTALFGVGIVTLFNSVFNYLAFSYPTESASVFAGNALFRAAFGASFPLFATAFFGRLGIGKSNAVLGCIAAVFVPVTGGLYMCGGRVRGWSRSARRDV
ncbi:multidrug resistance protein [Paraphaeosphaeria sporulosa]